MTLNCKNKKQRLDRILSGSVTLLETNYATSAYCIPIYVKTQKSSTDHITAGYLLVITKQVSTMNAETAFLSKQLMFTQWGSWHVSTFQDWTTYGGFLSVQSNFSRIFSL